MRLGRVERTKQPEKARHQLRLRSRAWSIAIGYFVMAGLWIYFSDQALAAIVEDPELFLVLSVYKGWFFVAFTAGILLLLMLRIFGAIERSYRSLESARTQLGASRSQLAAIIDSAMDAMIAVDAEGRIQLYNPAAEHMFERTAKEVLDCHIDDLVPEAGTVEPTLQWATVGLRANGDRFPIEASVSRVAGDGSSHTIFILRDISERRDRLREIGRLSRLYSALSQINQAIVRMRSRDALFETVCRVLVEQGRLRMAWVGWHDPDSQRLLPAARWGDESRYLDSVEIYGDDRPEGRGPTGIAFREGRPYIANVTLDDPATLPWREHIETHQFYACAVFPILEDGVVRGTLSVYAATPGFFQDKEIALLARAADDVSYALDHLANEQERLLAESALREMNVTLEQRVADRTVQLEAALERAEVADQMKSAFLATMSHELRTPLNSIIGFTGMVLQELAGPLNAEQAKQLGMVRGSARHLLELINDVLDLSKIEAGQLEVNSEPFDLKLCVQRATASVQPLAEAKNLSLHVQVSDAIGSMVGDARRVEQILLNLLANAIKFTEQGSVKLIVAPQPGYRATADAAAVDAVRISVADTGIGIKAEDLAKLFQPFQQLDTGLTRQHEGTGLGLTICKRLVTLMGGEILAESEWSVGSTFTVVLPVRSGPGP
ncbi:MAG: GAF domain-containing protein [Gammaproteobacteria bacterium]|nr:GAF domain-containing protein [Gammaproteobacteria bacterium]